MSERADIVIVGSGAGGGTVAAALADLCAAGRRILVLERGPKLRPEEFTGRELEMASALYVDGGGFLTADRAMTVAMGSAYGGSTAVYTGTSLVAPERVIRSWAVPDLTYADVAARSKKYMEQGNVHLVPPERINRNNHLFRDGCAALGWKAEQFPINLRDCRGASVCNLGCPNAAKQGTNVVQLPAAEEQGVEVVTRCEVLRLESGALEVRVSPVPEGGKGEPSSWAPGTYRVEAPVVVCSAGAVGTPALLLRSGLGPSLPCLGRGLTVHPALILVGEHEEPVVGHVGHPKSYYLDRGEEEQFLLETCMYFPFTTAKSLSGFGAEHASFLRSFDRLQMILVLACDKVDAHNRVSVTRSGQPVVHYRFTPQVRAALRNGNLAAARVFFAAGARRIHAPLARPHTISRDEVDSLSERILTRHFLPGRTPVSAAHVMGGCAMGHSARDSITDSRGRVHGFPGLFVADASLFPESVEVNPYLTVMSLADRVAEGIRETLGS
jgi:long-chain-alcohol oxidase